MISWPVRSVKKFSFDALGRGSVSYPMAEEQLHFAMGSRKNNFAFWREL
jgi:hypothetical protein